MRNNQLVLHIDIEISDNNIGADDREDERFTKAIEIGLKSTVAIEELASICCQSVSTFKRKFRARYSMSPHKWFMLHKLEIAYRIIAEQNVTIGELTKLCGYNNTSHFIAIFRKRYGISPARLSKQLREDRSTQDDKSPTDL